MCSIRSLLPGTIGGLDRYIGRYIDWYIGRFSTDYRWTADRLSVDYRSTVGRLSVGRRPIVYRQSFRPIKSWTVDIRAIHDRQLTDSCSIHDRYFTNTILHRRLTNTLAILHQNFNDTWTNYFTIKDINLELLWVIRLRQNLDVNCVSGIILNFLKRSSRWESESPI